MPRQTDAPPSRRKAERFPGIDPPIPGLFEPAEGDIVVSFDVLDEPDPADEPAWTLMTPLEGDWHPHGEPVRTEGGGLEIRFRDARAATDVAPHPVSESAAPPSRPVAADAAAPAAVVPPVSATPGPVRASAPSPTTIVPASPPRPERSAAAPPASASRPSRPAGPAEQVDARGQSWLAPQLPTWTLPASPPAERNGHVLARELPEAWSAGVAVGLTVGGSRELTADPAAESTGSGGGPGSASGGPLDG